MKTISLLYALATLLCVSLFFSCAPEIEPFPEQNASSSSDKQNNSSPSSSYSSYSSSSSLPPPKPSSSSILPQPTETYCLDYDWDDCIRISTFPPGLDCSDIDGEISNFCPSGWNPVNYSY